MTFLGEVDDDALALAYQAADLFVLPTRELEGFGLVTVEAMASGCPAVATPVGASPEILGPFDPALLSRDVGPAAIKDVIQNFLARRPEWPALRARAARYARERYSWDRVVADLEKIAVNMIKARTP